MVDARIVGVINN